MFAFTNLFPIIKIEEEILKLREYHKTMLDNLPVGIIGINTDKQIDYINKHFTQLTGNLVLGRHMNHIFSKCFKEPGYRIYFSSLASEKTSFPKRQIILIKFLIYLLKLDFSIILL